MTSHAPIRKVYFGIADRHQMFRLLDRNAGRPDRWQNDDSALYAGEWFEIAQAQHDSMLEILPPLWMRSEMFAMREFLTGSITSVFYTLRINQVTRFFHAYCDLSDPRSPYVMRDAIVERERQPCKLGVGDALCLHRGKVGALLGEHEELRVGGRPLGALGARRCVDTERLLEQPVGHVGRAGHGA